jgi:PP-loop superfamily ATP-utilizing enzyme
VRIGYLTLYESYGYQYVLSGAGKRVRRVIDGDDADQLWQFTPELRNIEETKITNPIIITPVGSVAHLIIVRISAAKRTCHYAVVMPASSVPEGSVPSVISEIVTRLQGNQLAIQVNA